jgi:hypothetical protein
MTHRDGVGVRLNSSGIEAFERAMDRLLSSQVVRLRYDVEEFWGVVASMVGTLPLSADAKELGSRIEQRIGQILAPPKFPSRLAYSQHRSPASPPRLRVPDHREFR